MFNPCCTKTKMKLNRRYGPFDVVLFLTLFLFSVGCTTAKVDINRMSALDMKSADSLVILPADKQEDIFENMRFSECVSKKISQYFQKFRFISSETFKDTLFPWFEIIPKTPEEFRLFIKKPEVQKRISELGVRYLIIVTGKTNNNVSLWRPFICSLFGCIGITWGGRETNLEADVWDLKTGLKTGEIKTISSGTVVVIGVVLPVPFMSMTETAVCNALGQNLIDFLNNKTDLKIESAISEEL